MFNIQTTDICLSGINMFMSGSKNWFEDYGKHPLQILNYSIFKPRIFFYLGKHVYVGIKELVRILWDTPPANLKIFNLQTTDICLSGINMFMSGSKNWFEDYGKHPLQILNYSIFKPRIKHVIWYKEFYIGIK